MKVYVLCETAFGADTTVIGVFSTPGFAQTWFGREEHGWVTNPGVPGFWAYEDGTAEINEYEVDSLIHAPS